MTKKLVARILKPRIEFDGNYAHSAYRVPFGYWVCMGLLTVFTIGGCIYAVTMSHTKNEVVRGEYAAENDRAMEIYGIAVPDRDE